MHRPLAAAVFAAAAWAVVACGCARAQPTPPRSLPTAPPKAPAASRASSGPVVLARDQLAYVADASGVFPSMLGTPGPRLVLAVLDEPPPLVEPDALGVHEVADEALAELGLPRPPAVWLVTPGGACQAELGGGYVGHYAEGPPAYELGYLLQPCAAGFGPLAVLADDVPARLRWIAATVQLDEPVDLPAWTHPLRAAFHELGLGASVDDAGRPAPVRRARILAVEGTPLYQLVAVDHWPAEEACDEQEVVTLGTALVDDEGLRWLVPPEAFAWDPDQAQLEGALVDGGVAVVSVHAVRFQAGLAIRDAAGDHQWIELDTGRYHDEDVAYSGYSVRQYCGP